MANKEATPVAQQKQESKNRTPDVAQGTAEALSMPLVGSHSSSFLDLPQNRATRPLRRQAVMQMQRKQGNTAVQRRLNGVPHIQRDGSQIEIGAISTPKRRIRDSWNTYEIWSEINWYYDSAPLPALVLILDLKPGWIKKYSPPQIAETGVSLLSSAAGLLFKEGKQQQLVQEIVNIFPDPDKSNFLYYPINLAELDDIFDPQSLHSFMKEHSLNATGEITILITNADLGAGDGGKTGTAEAEPQPKRDRDHWTRDQEKKVQELIDNARRQKPASIALPDRLVVYPQKKNGVWQWFMNVWVYFDTQGKDKTGHSIRLNRGETPEQLFERVQEAAIRAVNKRGDQAQRQREKLAPSWARDLKRRLWNRLEADRRKEGGSDFPDGLELRLEYRGQRTADLEVTEKPVAKEPEPQVLLEIYIESGKGPNLMRHAGTLPWELRRETTVDELLPDVRQMAAILRRWEKTPSGEQAPPPGEVTVTEPGTPFALAPFPAELKAVDMRDDLITVTGAKNEFSMYLDFETVYGASGQFKDIYIASKLSREYIHFFWRIYKVPSDEQMAGKDENVPQNWADRSLWLTEKYNTPITAEALENNKVANKAHRALGEPVYKSDGSELSKRVEFPPEPGDYIVYCETGYGPIGENNLQRVSSRSYLPVRVKPIEEVATAYATSRGQEIKALEKKIADFKKELGTERESTGEARGDAAGGRQETATTAGSETAVLDLEREAKKADLLKAEVNLDSLNKIERQTLAENTENALGYVTKTLPLVKELEEKLPVIINLARQDSKTPSAVIREKYPHLLPAYEHVLSESKTVSGFRQELENTEKHLKGQSKRIKAFRGYFEEGSNYRYQPEAAFVSKMDGKVYPLAFELGLANTEKLGRLATDMLQGQAGVAYSLVDVTTEQTRKVYYGFGQSHKEAIDQAFKEFAEEAEYGSGTLAVRIPLGKLQTPEEKQNHPGTDVKIYQCEKGWLQKTLDILAKVAMVAGAIALVMTGAGLPALAAIAGVVAATAGAITAVHGLSELSRREWLDWDHAPQIMMQVLDIISVVPALKLAGMAVKSLGRGLRTTRALSGAAEARGLRLPPWYAFDLPPTGKFWQVYGVIEDTASTILIPTQLAFDLRRIYDDQELTDEEKENMAREAIGGTIQSGIMKVANKVAGHVGAARMRGRMSAEDILALQQQVELVELEATGTYRTMADRGYWTGEEKRWTDTGRQKIGVEIKEPSETITVPKEKTAPSETGDTTKKAPPPKPDVTGRKSSPPVPEELQPLVPGSPTRKRPIDAEQQAKVSEKIEELELPPGTPVMPPDRKNNSVKEELRYVRDAQKIFDNMYLDDPLNEAAIYRNSETGQLVIIKGDSQTVYVKGTTGEGESPAAGGQNQPWKELLDGLDVGEWILAVHYHPIDPKTGAAAHVNRFPSGASADMGIAVAQSLAAGGQPNSSKITYITEHGPDYTIFGYNPRDAKPLWVEFPDPVSGYRRRMAFADLESYHAWMKQIFNVDLGPVPDALKRGKTPATPGSTEAPKEEGEGSPAPVSQPTTKETSPSSTPKPQADQTLGLQDANGHLTDQGVEFIRKNFQRDSEKRPLAEMSDEQIRQQYSHEWRWVEKVVIKEVAHEWQGKETATDFAMTNPNQNFVKVADRLEKATLEGNTGHKVDRSVLGENTFAFVQRLLADNDPVLAPIVEGIRNHPSADVRRRWQRIIDLQDNFLIGKIGDKKPDILEVQLSQNLISVLDVSLAYADPIHNFKTAFYRAVLERLIDVQVRSADYRSALRQSDTDPEETP